MAITFPIVWGRRSKVRKRPALKWKPVLRITLTRIEKTVRTPGLSDFMNSKYVRMAISSSLGLCFGAALGIALHNLGVGAALGLNLGVGIALGVLLGAVFGAALGIAPDAASAPRKATSDKPLPHPLGLKKG